MRHDPRAVAARKLRNAGIGTTVVGTVLGLGAAAMFFVDPCEPEPGNDCRESRRRAAALAMGIPAGAVFITGVSMIAVGQGRLRRLLLSFRASRAHLFVGLGGGF
jgi:hypothetical protein